MKRNRKSGVFVALSFFELTQLRLLQLNKCTGVVVVFGSLFNLFKLVVIGKKESFLIVYEHIQSKNRGLIVIMRLIYCFFNEVLVIFEFFYF